MFVSEHTNPFDSENPDFWVKIEHLGRYLFVAEECRKVGMEPEAYILDAACGSGYGAYTLANYGFSIFACDANEEYLNIGKSQFSHERIFYFQADLDNLLSSHYAAFLPQKAKCVVAFECLEHILYPEKALAALADMLAEEGLLFCSVPNAKYEKLSPQGEIINPYHTQIFSRERLEAILHSAGFTVESVLGQPFVKELLRRENTLSKAKVLNTRSARVPDLHTPEAIDFFARLFAFPEDDPAEEAYSLIIVAKRCSTAVSPPLRQATER